MKKYLNIKTGLFLSFLLVILMLFFGNTQDSNEVLEENKVIAQSSKQHNSQEGTSVSKEQETIKIKFRVKPEFDKNSN